MELRIASDFHLEFYRLRDEILNERLDININKVLPVATNESNQILILAGDITNVADLKKYKKIFDEISDRFKYVLMVAGNHEHYGYDYNKTIPDFKEFLKQYSNIKLLDNETFIHEDVSFFGCTWWTELEFSPWETIQSLKHMSDYRCIKDGAKNLSYFKTTDAHRRSNDEIEYFMKNNKSEKKVIITHHAPSEQSSLQKFKGHVLQPCFINNYENKILDLQPNLWLHGHVHNFNEYYIGNTKVVSNPYGYQGENPDYKSIYILTI